MLVAVALTIAPASARSQEGRPVRVTAYMDNDERILSLLTHSDRGYTNGIGLSVAWQPPWARWLARKVPFRRTDRAGFGLMVAQQMFTPIQIWKRDLVAWDRPYVGLLFLGAWWQRADHLVQEHVELQVGWVGPGSLADRAQAWVHRGLGAVVPRGWDHQVQDEPVVQLLLRRRWRLGVLGGTTGPLPWALQVLPEAELALGNLRVHAEGGALVRWGWGLPDDFGPARLSDPPDATAPPHLGFTAALFAGVRLRLVHRDLTLEGNTWQPSHRVEPHDAVAEVRGGLTVGHGWRSWGVALTWSETWESASYETSPYPSHTYGSVVLTVSHWPGPRDHDGDDAP